MRAMSATPSPPGLEKEKELRIVIAEDVDLVAEAFEALLSTEPSFEVVARVSRGDLVLRAVAAHRPDLVLMDVDMPGATGIEATAQLREKGYRGKILLLTALQGSGHLHAAVQAGANGYLLKTTTGARLMSSIRAVMSGHTAIDPDLAAEALRVGPCPLSERELQILRLIANGSSTSEAAKQLCLSQGTVRNYLSAVMTKLDATSRIQAVETARSQGWL